MEPKNTYYATLTEYGINFVQKNLSGGGKFIAEGWYIALGIGETNPSLETKDLANRIYDKYSEGYPGIRIEDDPEIGRAAYIQAPRSLQGNIITEMGLFDGTDNLIMSAKTYIDMTKGFEYGLNKVFDIGISLFAIPADVDIVVVNPPSAYPTYQETQNLIAEHNIDPEAHSYLARKNELIQLKTDVETLINQVYDWRIGKLFIEFSENIDLTVSFIADGKPRKIADMPKLYAKWGTKYGGDGITTFGTPQIAGRFLRALDLNNGLDPGRTLGSVQDDAMQRITGQIETIHGSSGCFKTGAQAIRLDTYKQTQPFYYTTFDNSLVARTADENRPKNIAFLPVIYFA